MGFACRTWARNFGRFSRGLGMFGGALGSCPGLRATRAKLMDGISTSTPPPRNPKVAQRRLNVDVLPCMYFFPCGHNTLGIGAHQTVFFLILARGQNTLSTGAQNIVFSLNLLPFVPNSETNHPKTIKTLTRFSDLTSSHTCR